MIAGYWFDSRLLLFFWREFLTVFFFSLLLPSHPLLSFKNSPNFSHSVFEVTNTLFQVTALDNNIHDAKASAPDLSAGRAIQTMFLYMPGTTPGIFLYIVFGTTAASRQKTKDLLLPEWLRDALAGFLNRFCCCCGGCCLRPRSTTSPSGGKHLDQTAYTEGGITVERSLTITSASRINRTTSTYEDDEFSNLSDISLGELNKRPDSTLRSYQISRMKPLPLAPQTPISKFTTTVSHGGGGLIGRPPPPPPEITNPAFGGGLSAIEEKSIMDSGLITRTNSDDSLRVPDDYHGLGPEHSDDSGPILPIQKPEVRFSTEIFYSSRERGERQSKNFSRPKRWKGRKMQEGKGKDGPVCHVSKHTGRCWTISIWMAGRALWMDGLIPWDERKKAEKKNNNNNNKNIIIHILHFEFWISFLGRTKHITSTDQFLGVFFCPEKNDNKKKK